MRRLAQALPTRALIAACGLAAAFLLAPHKASAQVASVSAWDAADFRSWSFIPNWTSQSQINSFSTDRVYDHLSDVLYSFGVQPKADGSLYYTSASTNQMSRLKSDQAAFGFRYHMCMFTVYGGQTDSVWETITSNSTIRGKFVTNVKNLLAANNMTGMNLDWERPNSDAEWGNYTQLAKDMQAAFPASWEVSVDDYGYADSNWNDSPLFSANAFDQVGMMAYHYAASSQNTFANTHTALGFQDSQLILGMGTWGDAGPGTVTLKAIAAASPNLPADASSYTGTVVDINGTSRTGTWDIVSRYEVRDNVQLAINRGMAGVMWWALNYDATNKLSLARVAQHYAMFKKGVPDLNLDGKVNAADATALADNMGTVPGWTGTATQAQFENFYMKGNWEKGDRDGNGFVNQQDADWLAGKYAALGVALPDRLAYTGSFEKFTSSGGLTGRWQAVRARRRPTAGDRQLHAARRRLSHAFGLRLWRRQVQQLVRHHPQSERGRGVRLAQYAATHHARRIWKRRSTRRRKATHSSRSWFGKTPRRCWPRKSTRPIACCRWKCSMPREKTSSTSPSWASKPISASAARPTRRATTSWPTVSTPTSPICSSARSPATERLATRCRRRSLPAGNTCPTSAIPPFRGCSPPRAATALTRC